MAERATRDVVSRSAYLEMMAGRACPEGGVRIDAAHLGADFVLRNFPGMAERCAQFKYDLAHSMVPVSPSAHFFMGGATIDVNCHATLDKLFVAGEDAGGVHGANRLGGNGICDSCVYGRLAGKSIAAYLSKTENRSIKETAPGMVKDIVARLFAPYSRQNGTSPFANRREIQETNGINVGVVRKQSGLEQAITDLASLRQDVERASVSGNKAYNMEFNTHLDTLNMLDVSIMAAVSALQREETRGAHTREDFPDQRDDYGLFNTFMWRGGDGMPVFEKKDVVFKHKSLEECQKHKK